MKVEPYPRRVSMESLPPLAWAIRLTMDNPSPVPGTWSVLGER
jgi:hypothetical protein